MMMRLQIDECLEKARRSGTAESSGSERLWWGGLLEGRRWRGGKSAGAAESSVAELAKKAGSGKARSSAKDEKPIAKNDESAKAQALFDELVNDKNIPFDYPLDCCFARAHEMCRQLEAKGVKCGKTWYYSAGWPNGHLSVTGLPKTDVIPDGSLEWTYHVAPTVEVDGKTMVFDPSMFKGPVTPDEWRSKMVDTTSSSGKSAIIKNTDSKPFFTNPSGYIMEDPDYSEAKSRFERHEKSCDDMIAAEAAKTKGTNK